MIRAFLAALLLILSAPTLAQEWGPAGPQTPTYPEIDVIGDAEAIVAKTSPVLGDGTNFWGGNPPAESLQPTAIEFPTTYTDGLTNGGSTTGFDENKFRMTCAGGNAVVASKDSIKGYGQRRFGHLHYFWGARTVDENTTYTTLRTRAGELEPTCPGNGLWNSAYWFPAVIHPNARGDGIPRVKKVNGITVYYVCENRTSPPSRCTDILRNHRMIGGTDVDDPNEAAVDSRQAEIAAASAASSYSGYTRSLGADTPIRVTWMCISNVGVVHAQAFYLRNSAGADALNNCPSDHTIRAEINMQNCWDGKNLTSPNGRGHVRYAIYPVGYGNNPVCPTGWYMIPTIELKFDFSHRGLSDYGQWYCSSDASTTAATGVAMGACESMHVDYVNGMDPRVAADWQRYCTANKDSADYIGACNDNTVNASLQRLNGDDVGSFGPWTGDNDNDWISIPNEGSNKRVRLRKGM